MDALILADIELTSLRNDFLQSLYGIECDVSLIQLRGVVMLHIGTIYQFSKRGKQMQRVLFLCTGNSARSQIAEAILRKLGGEGYEVHSAGTDIASEVNPYAIEVLREIDVSVAGLHPKKVNRFTSQDFDLVITVCENAKQQCPHFPGAKQMQHWSLEDPAAYQGSHFDTLTKFREIRNEVESRVRERILKREV